MCIEFIIFAVFMISTKGGNVNLFIIAFSVSLFFNIATTTMAAKLLPPPLTAAQKAHLKGIAALYGYKLRHITHADFEDHRFDKGSMRERNKPERIKASLASYRREQIFFSITEDGGRNYFHALKRRKSPFRPNYALAFEQFSIAARSGHIDAQFYLGLFSLYGRGCKKNIKIARHWLRKAAVKKHCQAQFLMGFLLEVTSTNDAIIWYGRAAKLGHDLARLVLESKMSTLDDAKTILELEKFRTISPPTAIIKYNNTYFGSTSHFPIGYHKELLLGPVFKWHCKNANSSSPTATQSNFIVARIFDEGHIKPRSWTNANRFYRRARDKGFKEAAYRLSQLQNYGLDEKQHYRYQRLKKTFYLEAIRNGSLLMSVKRASKRSP